MAADGHKVYQGVVDRMHESEQEKKNGIAINKQHKDVSASDASQVEMLMDKELPTMNPAFQPGNDNQKRKHKKNMGDRNSFETRKNEADEEKEAKIADMSEEERKNFLDNEAREAFLNSMEAKEKELSTAVTKAYMLLGKLETKTRSNIINPVKIRNSINSFLKELKNR